MEQIFVFEIVYCGESVTENFNVRETDFLAAWMTVVLAVGRNAQAIEFLHVQEPMVE